MAHNPIVDLAAKSLDDLKKAHWQDGLDMAAAMTDYAHSTGGDVATKKAAGLALVQQLQSEGHISAWAAGNFRAYFNLSPQELSGVIANTPTIPTPQQNLQDIGNAAKNAASSVTNDLLKPLFQANLWIRVAEVALGLILIAVGIAKMTNAIPLATKIAGVVK